MAGQGLGRRLFLRVVLGAELRPLNSVLKLRDKGLEDPSGAREQITIRRVCHTG
jgi:hypothetical protein